MLICKFPSVYCKAVVVYGGVFFARIMLSYSFDPWILWKMLVRFYTVLVLSMALPVRSDQWYSPVNSSHVYSISQMSMSFGNCYTLCINTSYSMFLQRVPASDSPLSSLLIEGRTYWVQQSNMDSHLYEHEQFTHTVNGTNTTITFNGAPDAYCVCERPSGELYQCQNDMYSVIKDIGYVSSTANIAPGQWLFSPSKCLDYLVTTQISTRSGCASTCSSFGNGSALATFKNAIMDYTIKSEMRIAKGIFYWISHLGGCSALFWPRIFDNKDCLQKLKCICQRYPAGDNVLSTLLPSSTTLSAVTTTQQLTTSTTMLANISKSSGTTTAMTISSSSNVATSTGGSVTLTSNRTVQQPTTLSSNMLPVQSSVNGTTASIQISGSGAPSMSYSDSTTVASAQTSVNGTPASVQISGNGAPSMSYSDSTTVASVQTSVNGTQMSIQPSVNRTPSTSYSTPTMSSYFGMMFYVNTDKLQYHEAKKFCQTKLRADLVSFDLTWQYVNITMDLELQGGFYWVNDTGWHQLDSVCTCLQVSQRGLGSVSTTTCTDLGYSVCARVPDDQAMLVKTEPFRQMIAELTVDRKDTTKAARQKVSIWDVRRSAHATGGTSVVIVVTLMTLIVISDIPRLKNHCQIRRCCQLMFGTSVNSSVPPQVPEFETPQRVVRIEVRHVRFQPSRLLKNHSYPKVNPTV